METERRPQLIRNSFQTPNFYVDRLMPLLTDPEWRVLGYAVRRILGFHKHEDQISLSQFSNGIVTRQGKQLDSGTGLGASAVKRALTGLCACGVLVKVRENDARVNEGCTYSLVTEPDLIDWLILERRAEARGNVNRHRTQAASSRRKRNTRSSHDPAIVTRRTLLPSDDDAPLSSHVGHPPMPDVDTSTRESTDQTQSEIQRDGARAAERRIGSPDGGTLWEEALRFWGYTPTAASREKTALTQMARRGISSAQLAACYRHFKSQAFHAERHLSMHFINQHIDAWLRQPRIRQDQEGGNLDGTISTCGAAADRIDERTRAAFEQHQRNAVHRGLSPSHCSDQTVSRMRRNDD